MEGSFGCSFDLDDDILCVVNQVENDYINRQTDKTTKNIKGDQSFGNESTYYWRIQREALGKRPGSISFIFM